MADLPPGVYEENGQLYRDDTRLSAEGEDWTQHRLVALTFSEAKLKHWDWYHPKFGWLLEGYKLAKDRDLEDIMSDGSEVVVVSPDKQLELAETEGA